MATTAKKTSSTKKAPVAKKAPTVSPVAKKAADADPKIVAMAKELATLQTEVQLLKADLADLKASKPRTAPAIPGSLKGVEEKIGKIVSMLRRRSVIRDADIADAGL